MGLRGPKPKGKVNIKWFPDFAYAIGLLASDGCLSNDGRHILFVSKDEEQIKNYLKALGIEVFVAVTLGLRGSRVFRVQFGDIIFYQFLLSIGLTQAKSKTIGSLKIPSQYFFDFLRGSFDGDGSFYSYFDPRWKSSFMFYTIFASASRKHIDWIRNEILKRLKIKGHVTKDGNGTTFQLKYAKQESLELLPMMYYSNRVTALSRKRNKIKRALAENRKNYRN